jgi:hypothetical protein
MHLRGCRLHVRRHFSAPKRTRGMCPDRPATQGLNGQPEAAGSNRNGGGDHVAPAGLTRVMRGKRGSACRSRSAAARNQTFAL